MNKKLAALLSAGALCCMGLAACGGDNAPAPAPTPTDDGESWSVSAPAGGIEIKTYLEYGELAFDVKKGGTQVVGKSALGISTDKNDFVNLEFVEKKTDSKTVSYTNISGKKKEATNSYNELTLTFKEEDFYLDLVMRAYTDGYAFRYNVRAVDGSTGTFEIVDENTNFALDDRAQTWGQPYKSCGTQIAGGKDNEYFAYEEKFQYLTYKNISDERYCFPFLYAVDGADGKIYSLITESDIYGKDYFGSFLQKSGSSLKTIENPANGLEKSRTAAYPFTSPWRVATVGGLDTIVESTLNEDVYGEVEYWKPDNYDTLSAEEKKIYDYDWVDPGCGVWSYLNYGHLGFNAKNATQRNWELQKHYVDAVVDMGWKWIVLDAGWDEGVFDAVAFKEFTSYCKSKGVHVMVWTDSFKSFHSRVVAQGRLAQWAELGIEGVKIDFYDGQTAPNISDAWKGEAQQALAEHYEMFYQEAAKVKMVVDCHGANKPTGERRIYPNVINREAVRGNEFKDVDAVQSTLLPFLRGAIGPTDFTPAIVPYNAGTVTTAHNMGLAVVLESGMTTFSDEYTHYYGANYLDFYKNMPALWDETRFIAAELEDYAIIARRSGKKWYIGCTAASARNIKFDLGKILGNDEYSAKLWTDGSDFKTVEADTQTVTKSTQFDVRVAKGGGFAMLIET